MLRHSFGRNNAPSVTAPHQCPNTCQCPAGKPQARPATTYPLKPQAVPQCAVQRRGSEACGGFTYIRLLQLGAPAAVSSAVRAALLCVQTASFASTYTHDKTCSSQQHADSTYACELDAPKHQQTLPTQYCTLPATHLTHTPGFQMNLKASSAAVADLAQAACPHLHTEYEPGGNNRLCTGTLSSQHSITVDTQTCRNHWLSCAARLPSFPLAGPTHRSHMMHQTLSSTLPDRQSGTWYSLSPLLVTASRPCKASTHAQKQHSPCTTYPQPCNNDDSAAAPKQHTPVQTTASGTLNDHSPTAIQKRRTTSLRFTATLRSSCSSC